MRLAGAHSNAAKHELAAEVVRQFGEARIKVTGTSMLPAVWPGDVLTVRRNEPSELLPGRIVLCHRDGRFFIHRLVGRRKDGVITRGDSLGFEDPAFRDDQVLGEVVSIVRDGRPASLSPAWWHEAGSWMVRHSDLCERIFLRLRRLPKLLWVN